MFGKVQEDSFQSIFDMSLDEALNGDRLAGSSSSKLSLGVVGSSTQLGHMGNGNFPQIRQSEALSANLVASLLALQKQQQQQQQQINSQHSPSSPGAWGNNSWGIRGNGVPESPTSSISSFDSMIQRGRQQFDTESDSSSSSSSSGSSSGNKSCAVPINSSRYKTEMCRPYQENGTCKYGDKCQFAHGLTELRTISRHPKYKTDLCRTYHSSGFCPYGPRCHFIHNLDEQQQAVASPPGLSNGGDMMHQQHRQTKSAEKENCQGAQQLPAQLPMFQSPRSTSTQAGSNQQEAVIRSAAAQMMGMMKGELSGKHQQLLYQQQQQLARSNESSALQQQLFGASAAASNHHQQQQQQPRLQSRLPVFSTLYN